MGCDGTLFKKRSISGISLAVTIPSLFDWSSRRICFDFQTTDNEFISTFLNVRSLADCPISNSGSLSLRSFFPLEHFTHFNSRVLLGKTQKATPSHRRYKCILDYSHSCAYTKTRQKFGKPRVLQTDQSTTLYVHGFLKTAFKNTKILLRQKLIPDHQFGFKVQLATTKQVHRVVRTINNDFKEAFIDIA